MAIPEPVIHIDHEAAVHLHRSRSDTTKLLNNLTTNSIALRAKMARRRDPSRGHEFITKVDIDTVDFQVSNMSIGKNPDSGVCSYFEVSYMGISVLHDEILKGDSS